MTMHAWSQRGASLLEILITMLIMSFGLLALGGLTAQSLQFSKVSQFQTIGMQLSSDYADRMRANVSGFNAGSYDQKTAYSGSSSLVNIPACSAPESCTTAEMAAIDIAEWTNSLRQRLPLGGAYVARNANGLSADIWIMWVNPDMKFDSNNDLSASGGGNQCPTAAGLANLTEGTPVPQCLYFRVNI